ncbi:hypothetical protein AB0D11_21490 [Streptomyces monashensis]
MRGEAGIPEWFARGADDSAVLHALTAGLPSPVHHTRPPWSAAA